MELAAGWVLSGCSLNFTGLMGGLTAVGERADAPRLVEAAPGAGHACNIDQPVAYNQAVRGFAREISWGD